MLSHPPPPNPPLNPSPHPTPPQKKQNGCIGSEGEPGVLRVCIYIYIPWHVPIPSRWSSVAEPPWCPRPHCARAARARPPAARWTARHHRARAEAQPPRWGDHLGAPWPGPPEGPLVSSKNALEIREKLEKMWWKWRKIGKRWENPLQTEVLELGKSSRIQKGRFSSKPWSITRGSLMK